MAARGHREHTEIRLLRSPHHDDNRSLAELAAIDSEEELHIACVANHRCLLQLADGRYVLAHQADRVGGLLGLWVSAELDGEPNADEDQDGIFQPLPFDGARAEAPRLIILGFTEGRFTADGRDYWVSAVEANELGIRAVTLTQTTGTSRGGAIGRSVEDFVTMFFPPAQTTTTRSPARSPGGRGAAAPAAAIVPATIDVSRRQLGRALRLWPRWAEVAPSLATPTQAAIRDLEELLEPLMGRPVSGRTAVLSALAKVDGRLKLDARRKQSLATVIQDLTGTPVSTAEVGSLFNDHLCPGSTPAGTPRRGRQAGGGRAPRPTAPAPDDDLQHLDSGDDGEATDSDDSGGEHEAPTPARGRGAAPRTPATSGDEDGGDGDELARVGQQRGAARPRVSFASEELSRISPPGVPPLTVAGIIFKERAIAEAASYVLPPDIGNPDERAVYEERAGRAIQRLREDLGDRWPSAYERPRDMESVRQLRERLLELVQNRHARGDRALYQPDGPSNDTYLLRGPAAGYVPVEREGGSGEKALPPEVRPFAVSSDVAERLHRRDREIPDTGRHGDVGAGIRATPEDLREDLVRAVGSNGRVDAAGERRAERRTLPSKVKSMRDALVSRVQRALLNAAASDKSGSQYMAPDAAEKLASLAVTGKLDPNAFVKGYRESLGRRAPDTESLEELRGAWKLIRLALMASAAPLLDMQVDDIGIQEIDAHLGATAGATRIPTAKLRLWLQRVLSSWELMWQDFRLLEDDTPSLTACVAQHCTFMAVGSAAAVMRDELSAELREELRNEFKRSGKFDGRKTSTPQQRGGERKKRGRNTREKSTAEGGTAKDKQSAWPDKPRMAADTFREFREAVKTKCASSCQFFLTGTCFKKSCPASHEIPESFLEIKRRYASSGGSSRTEA